MPFERPTFHESWYRVAEMYPRLRSTVQVSRQHFRGETWHVIQDHTNNAFFRLSAPAYMFLGLLNGRTTIAEAWKITNDQLGDDAPTQGEVIQLLGQLYTSNLLQAEVPEDTHGLFTRYKKRRAREIQGYLMNLMFIKIPLLDPDAFLDRWIKLLGWIFSIPGLLLWLVIFSFGMYALSSVPNVGSELWSAGKDVLDPSNILLLYLAFAAIKACHEFGHAISCKKFGRDEGTGGEVHVMGIMFLVFSPVPYVDASSAWALKSKWRRFVVGGAGMWIELAIASVFAMVWAWLPGYLWVHQLAFNIMFVASVSTILFNANPLLRYDGYYMLSDLIEIPNLGQRANDYVYYLVKRYAWNVTQARNPSYSNGEAAWLVSYAITSFAMRVFVSFAIMFYLANVLDGALIVIAAVMVIAGVFAWVLMPIGKFLRYLVTSPELVRVRTRAVSSTILTTAAFICALTLIPLADHARAQGVVEPVDVKELRPLESGAVVHVASLVAERHVSGEPVVSAGTALLVAESPTLQAHRAQLLAERRRLELRRNAALGASDSAALAQTLTEQVRTVNELIAHDDEQIARLTVRAPIDGVLVAPRLEKEHGLYLKRGDKLGLVAKIDGLHDLIVRAAASNDMSGPLRNEAKNTVEIRVKGRPDLLLTGRIAEISQAGQNQLPSAALGYAAGGDMAVSPEDRNGTQTTERFFDVRIRDLKFVGDKADQRLLPGQRVVVRFTFHDKSLAEQGWIALLQLIQRRLGA